MMKVQLLRNATLIVTLNGKNILVDPMLAPKDSYPPIPFTANTLKNPIVDLPLNDTDLKALIKDIDAILLTHLHNDHWDPTARELLEKDTPVYCQPEDAQTVMAQGFTNVNGIQDQITWQDTQIIRTAGQHGTGTIREKLGNVSGYILKFEKDDLYIAGDTIWCNDVQQAIDQHHPSHIIVNGGCARFLEGDPIIMDTNDIVTLCKYSPSSKVYVVHLEAVNHCTESRAATQKAIAANNLTDKCYVPNDAEVFYPGG